MNGFDKEKDFEEALIKALQRNGWEQNVIHHPTEEDLLKNWADILYENNQGIDRLNKIPLNAEEMNDILKQVQDIRTPQALNGFINGKTISIKRKNPEDTLHYGKEVSLKLYDRMEIAAGQSRYQIVQQPEFSRKCPVLQDRRGDLMLLINGMPVFHIELKKSGIPVSEACHQIEKYAHEGIFTGLFSLVQIFVAMNPEEMLYFANPGPDGRFNPDFYFHWADFNNEPVNDWKKLTQCFLNIPMAHQLIGFYTVADSSDGVLKVMRSYQYYAANKISDRVARQDWRSGSQLGGYIWHTTGSGKTMTSFKSAQLIANSKDADKVVFLMDRIELGTQSLKEYRAFADNADDVQGTEDTVALISKLKSNDPKDTLIVSSIQKMSNIHEGETGKLISKDLERMKSKRIVFIIDECHRSTFGDMLSTIKATFPNALFFGFTGTPVFTENERMLTTADIFGNELHRYSIADGIRDGNVLGFDPTMVNVYRERDIREQVALQETKASTINEVLGNPIKEKVYYHFTTPGEVPMACESRDGQIVDGIEDYVPEVQYQTDEYRRAVVQDISDNWIRLSRGGKFHAIFATSSIPDAIKYYHLFKEICPSLHITGLFDPTIDNTGGDRSIMKEDGLREMLEDYNSTYEQHFDIGGYARFKKDVAARLAHKHPYIRIPKDKQLNLLIVVNQMLTGFDSKWINTLYLDKVLEYQNLIQAFSRTNRLFNINEKPFGNIRYYRRPYTMKSNIEKAISLFSGNRPQGLFADHLPENIRHMNAVYGDIVDLFKGEGICNFDKLPEEDEVRAKFAKLFRKFTSYLQAAQMQGFIWAKKKYEYSESEEEEKITIEAEPEESIYRTFLQRYKELRFSSDDPTGDEEVPFDIDPYLVEINTDTIDADYMESRFRKWLKDLTQENVDPDKLKNSLEQLHKSFAGLSQEEQKLANLILHDIETGDLKLDNTRSFRDYLTMYANNVTKNRVDKLVERLGCNKEGVYELMNAGVTAKTINEYGRFDTLADTVVREKAAEYFSSIEGKKLPPFRVNNKARSLLREFILAGGEDIPEAPEKKSDCPF